MRKEEFFDNMSDTFSDMLATSKRKNADYCGNDDPFANFKHAEGLGICSVERAMLVRMSDKFSRICNLVDQNVITGQVADEKVYDTLIDLANYAVIMSIYMKAKE